MNRRGMTLIELVVIVWLLGCVCGGASWGGVRSAWLVVPGMLAGLALGLLVPTVLLFSLDRFFRWWRPRRPRCFAGRCRQDDYTWASSDGRTRWRCACGDTYVERDERFLRLVREDVELAYMRRDAHGRRWVPDSRPATGAAPGPR